MKGKRVKTYMATLMADKKFREKFEVIPESVYIRKPE